MMSKAEAEGIAIQLQRAGMFNSVTGFLLAAETIHWHDNAGKYMNKDWTTTDDVMEVAYTLRLYPTEDEITRLLIKCERVWQSGGAVEREDLIDYFLQVHTQLRNKSDLVWWLQHGWEGEAAYRPSDIQDSDLQIWQKGGRIYIFDGDHEVSARLLPATRPGGEPLIDVKDWQ